MYKFGINRSIGTAESAFARAIGQTMQSLKSGRANREYHTVEDNYDVRLPGPAGNMTDDNWRIEQLEKSLMEKDILLSELQHRVKNDLNIILSLINLQMDKIHDNGSRQILVDLKARISTITSVYRQLSFSDIAGYVDLRSHVRNIAECLFNI